MMKETENQPSPSSPETCSRIPDTFRIADIVESLNGRDVGKRFIVIGTDDEYSLIADGKGRRYEKPKKKKNKHLKYADKTDDNIKEKLLENEKITNSEIRRILAGYTAEINNEGGMQDAKR